MKCILGHEDRKDNCPACNVIMKKGSNPFCRNPEWCLQNNKCESVVKYDRACND